MKSQLSATAAPAAPKPFDHVETALTPPALARGRTLLATAALLMLAGCATQGLTPALPENRSGEAAGVRGADDPVRRADPSVELKVSIPDNRVAMAQLIDSLETADQPAEVGSDADDAGGAPMVADTVAPVIPGDLWDRIRDGFAMPELDTPLVADKEKFYLGKPDYLDRMMTRGGRYLYHIVEELERRNMPLEIALLPFVESAMNPVALSSAQAAGLWQFIPSTGRQYDLKQNWWVDNRRDVVQSTRAALDYLQMLHDMHDGDWFLALASYNWGEGAVNRAIKRNKAAGKPTDYLSLRMPRETRHYVPKLIALKNILLNAEALGVALPELPDKPYFVVIEKTRPIDLDLAATFAGLTTAEFVALNPAHNRPVISASRNNQIKIPAENLDSFLAAMKTHEAAGKNFVTWQPYTLASNETIEKVAKRTGIPVAELLRANSLSSKRTIIAGTRLLVPSAKGVDAKHIEAFAAPTIVEIVNSPARYHRVRASESLGLIGKRWGVSGKTLKQWNGLASDKVRKGQRLIVRQPSRQTIQTSAQGKTQVLSAKATQTLVFQPANQHTVSRGENLGGIARKYGVTIRQLQQWNSLRGSVIRIGQRLTVAPTKLTRLDPDKVLGAGSAQHRVKRGDTLSEIASQYQVSMADVQRWNGLRGSIVRVGQKLRVKPKSTKTLLATAASSSTSAQVISHHVKRGDTLSGIATRYGVSVRDLRAWNRLRNDNIRLGEKLEIQQPAKQSPRKRAGKLTWAPLYVSTPA